MISSSNLVEGCLQYVDRMVNNCTNQCILNNMEQSITVTEGDETGYDPVYRIDMSFDFNSPIAQEVDGSISVEKWPYYIPNEVLYSIDHRQKLFSLLHLNPGVDNLSLSFDLLRKNEHQYAIIGFTCTITMRRN